MLQIDSRQFVQEYGLLACIQCGKCTGGCPNGMKTKLNPRSLIYRLLVAGNGFDLEGARSCGFTTARLAPAVCPKLVNPMEASSPCAAPLSRKVASTRMSRPLWKAPSATEIL